MKRLVHVSLDTLVPHERNSFRPYLLRTTGVIAALFIFAVFAFGSVAYKLALTQSDYLASVLPSVLVDLANQDRAVNALGSLTVDPLLVKAAQLKANDMAAKGYFAHISPDGKEPWYWFNEAGYSFVYAGENLAVNFDDSAAVNTAWMNSPTHRANILGSHYTQIGIATAQGLYEGKTATFVVEEFGSPALTAAQATQAPLTVGTSTSTTNTTPTAVAHATTTKTQTLVAIAGAEVPAVEGAPIVKGTSSYIAVQDTSARPMATSTAPEASSSTHALAPVQAIAPAADHFFTSPSLVLQVVYTILGFLLLIGFVGVLVVPHEHQHRHLVRLGVLFVGLLLLYFLAGYLMFSHAMIG